MNIEDKSKIYNEITENELKNGIEEEHEHKDTYEWFIKYYNDNKKFPDLNDFAKHIALDHLKKIKIYYSLLKIIEKYGNIMSKNSKGL